MIGQFTELPQKLDIERFLSNSKFTLINLFFDCLKKRVDD